MITITRPVRAHQYTHTHTHTRDNRWTSTRSPLDMTTLWCFLKRNKGIQSTCTTSTPLLSPMMQCRFTARVRRSMGPTNTAAHTNSPAILFVRKSTTALLTFFESFFVFLSNKSGENHTMVDSHREENKIRRKFCSEACPQQPGYHSRDSPQDLVGQV